MILSDVVRLIMYFGEKVLGGEIFILKMLVIRFMDFVEIVIEEIVKKMYLKINEIEIENIGVRLGERKFEEFMIR